MLQEMRAVVRKIPKGKVATYGQIAEAAGFPGNARRVAWALRNTDGRLPWHRVLGSGGKILLPKDAGAEQCLRLEAEGVGFRRGRVDMEKHAWQPGKRR
jgi:methylated-DNA-protein-cysteine methyltransferase-like protein